MEQPLKSAVDLQIVYGNLALGINHKTATIAVRVKSPFDDKRLFGVAATDAILH